MGDSDWPKQKGELTHRGRRGWIENDQCSGSGRTAVGGDISGPEIQAGRETSPAPVCFVSRPAETDSHTMVEIAEVDPVFPMPVFHDPLEFAYMPLNQTELPSTAVPV